MTLYMNTPQRRIHNNRSAWQPMNAMQDFDWSPRVDARETEDAYHFYLDMPGVNQDDMKITVNNDVLSIHGVRKPRYDKEDYYRKETVFGAFKREFALYSKVNAKSISASLQNGILEITLPKTKAAKPREIQVM